MYNELSFLWKLLIKDNPLILPNCKITSTFAYVICVLLKMIFQYKTKGFFTAKAVDQNGKSPSNQNAGEYRSVLEAASLIY